MAHQAIEWLKTNSKIHSDGTGIFNATLPERMVSQIWQHVAEEVPADMKSTEPRYMNWTDGIYWYEIQDNTGQRYSKAKYTNGRTHIRFEFGLME